MSNEKENKLSEFFDKNPSFRGKFVGYYAPRGGLGISRIDDDWYECSDYLISIDNLIGALDSQGDGWIKYDPKDESTWPKEGYRFNVYTKQGYLGIGRYSISSNHWEDLNDVTHYQERPSKPLDK